MMIARGTPMVARTRVGPITLGTMCRSMIITGWMPMDPGGRDVLLVSLHHGPAAGHPGVLRPGRDADGKDEDINRHAFLHLAHERGRAPRR